RKVSCPPSTTKFVCESSFSLIKADFKAPSMAGYDPPSNERSFVVFPNPQDVIPLPQKPSLERYKKLAKDLTKACKASQTGDSDAIGAWAEKWLKSLASLTRIKD